METGKDYQDELAGKDLGLLLFLGAACPFGLLSWFGLFSAARWTVLAIWSAAAGMPSDPLIIPTTPVMFSRVAGPPASSFVDTARVTSRDVWLIRVEDPL